ncbi:DUF4334 domain-containing protein [Nocardia higoensis]|uniref:DUF4334 domain-containing protein n=1 Tax=Nocardia higoensis TaxID=228599 RepID=UPI0002FDA017|nr:DUF4334 domain-containing protein [Nocardia higoensis]
MSVSTSASPIPEAEAVATLAALERHGGTYEETAAFFDNLPTVTVEDITLGRWRGGEIATGHPMDGLLAASGWYGKQFDSPEDVHPLLFSTPGQGIFAVDPRRVPLGLVDRVPHSLVARGKQALPVLSYGLRTKQPRARLRAVEFRGRVSAAMVYDHLPIIDVFRRVDEHTLLGAMDQRGAPLPYFFTLRLDR